MLQSSVQVCYVARSKYATLLGRSVLQFLVKVCCTLWSISMLHYSVQVCCRAHTPHRSNKWSIWLIYCIHVSFSSSMLHCSVQESYNARSTYAILLDKVCYTAARSKYSYVKLLGPSILYCSVQVCYSARSKYATLLDSSMLHCSVQVCYAARSKYATLLTHLVILGFIIQIISSEG